MSRRPPRVYLQRGIWRSDFSLPIPGRRKRRRFRYRLPGATSREEAQAMAAVLRDRLAKKLLDNPIGKRPDLSFRDYLEQVYLPVRKRNLTPATWRSYEQMLRNHILPSLGDRTLRSLRTEEIEQYLSSRAEGAGGRPLSPSTVNKHLSLIRVVLRHAHRRGYIESDPTADIVPEKVVLDRNSYATFTEEEAQRFLATTRRLRPRWFALFYTWNRTGCRLGELAAMTWSDIDLEGGFLHVNRAFSAGIEGPTKNRRKRVIPLDEEFQAVLREHLRAGCRERVFLSNDGQVLGHNKVKSTFRTLLRHSGVTPMRFHDGRHTFASHLAQHDVGETKIAELLGHSDSRTTKRYLHPRKEHLREAIERLPPLLTDEVFST